MNAHSYGMDILGCHDVLGAITAKVKPADEHFTAGTSGGFGIPQLNLDTSWMNANAPSTMSAPSAPPALAVVEAPVAAPAPTADQDALKRYEENQRRAAAATGDREAYLASLRTSGMAPAHKSVTEESWFWPVVGVGMLGLGFLGFRAFSNPRTNMLVGAR